MSSHGQTRRAAYEAACDLAAQGRRPSASAIRERLGGGGQQALLAGLNDWVDEAARRFQIPAIPEELRGALVTIWDLACREGEARWSQAREALERRVVEEEQAHSATRDERDAAVATVAEQDAEIQSLREELQRTQDAHQAAQGVLESRTEELREREATLAETTSARDALATRLDHEKRIAAAARESLEHAQALIATLQTQHEVAMARVEMLERAEIEAKGTAAQTRADLERSQRQADELRASLAERDAQTGALTEAVEREQQARDADAKHWMARVEELQVTIASYRDREAEFIKERRAGAKEVGRLRDELSNTLALLRSEREEAMRAKARPQPPDARE